jgi:glycogen debranching enzyme
MVAKVIQRVPKADGSITHLLTIMNFAQLTQLLGRLHDPSEFLAPHGVRSLSKKHEQEPFEFEGRRVGYEPAESVTKLKGGNSNWRGPIWSVVNWMIAEGFAGYGFEAAAARIRADTRALVTKNGFWEYFDPRDGTGLGGPDFSWTAAIDLLLTP